MTGHPRAPRRPATPAPVLLPTLLALLLAACGPAASRRPGATAPAPSPSPVVHVLTARSDDTADIFASAPPGPATPPPPGAAEDGTLTAQAFPGIPSVGAVYIDAGAAPGIHYCTASVVHSAGGDLIITAAHCVYNSLFGGYQNHILFVPGYHDETAPYGTWVATGAVVDARWIASEDPDADVAFLTVRRVGGGAGTLESLTGAHPIRSAPDYTAQVEVVAYPLGAEQPVSCRNHTSRHSASQLRFDCDGLPDGSSGAPFLADDGAVVGVVGGYQQGGDTPKTSYSAYFDGYVDQLYRAASDAT